LRSADTSHTAAAGGYDPTLVVIRGNSGSGKSTVARELRRRFGRGCALVEQDYLRRIVLRELDLPGGCAPELIGQTARFALAHGYHVVVEGIMAADRYAPMLGSLLADHRGPFFAFYLDVSLEECLRRHAGRPQAAEFTAEDVRSWYIPRDTLGVEAEVVVPETSSLEDTISLIQTTSRLQPALALTGV
jgi:predicted kinase